jgi:hypothetical protein
MNDRLIEPINHIMLDAHFVSGGMELLFDNQKSIKLALPHSVKSMQDLIAYTRDNFVKERPDLFAQGDTVYVCCIGVLELTIVRN